MDDDVGDNYVANADDLSLQLDSWLHLVGIMMMVMTDGGDGIDVDVGGDDDGTFPPC